MNRFVLIYERNVNTFFFRSLWGSETTPISAGDLRPSATNVYATTRNTHLYAAHSLTTVLTAPPGGHRQIG